MKNGWRTIPLEEVAVQEKGGIKIGPFGSQLRKRDLVASGIHVVGIENVLSGHFDGLGDRFISPEKFQTLKTVEILPGDLLMTMMGTIGKVAIAPEGMGRSIMDSHLLRVRPDRKLCRTDYLRWAVYGSPAVQKAMEAQAHGSIMQGLNSAIVRSLPIFLPPLQEQQRIVGILDKAFAGIATAKANAEKNLQNARALFESHLQFVFTQRGKGWSRKPLGSLCELISGQHIDAKDYNMEQRGIGYLTGPSDFGLRNPVVAKWTEHPKRMARRGDILITVKGSGVGKINLLDAKEVAISRQLMAVRATATDVSYLYAFLSTNFGYFQSLSKGAAIPGISREGVLELMCPMPPPREQQGIVRLINSVADET